MAIRLITPPQDEPISVAEAKLNLRVTQSTEDARIASMITDARETAEGMTGRALMPQTWEKVLDAFPSNEIELPYPPLVSIVSFTYIGIDGLVHGLGVNDYAVDIDAEPGYVLKPYGGEWPETMDVINAVRIRYTCGYADAAAVPASIREWMHMHIAEAFENRGMTQSGIATMPDHINRRLDRYRVMVIA